MKSVGKPSYNAKISWKLKDHMSKGYVNAAVNLLTNNIENGVLPLNAQTLSQLTDSTKAPILLHGSLPNIHSVWFQPIDVEMVREVCPSGMDADWHIILSSNQFGTSNTDLRKAFAEVIRRLCANFVERKVSKLCCLVG